MPPERDSVLSAAALGRQPALDGIRGVAVLIVLGHNLGWAWLKGGFFGVDVFFALSGFLITTLLLEEYAHQGTISLRRFFARRCLRLYPALVLVVAFSALSVLVFHPPVTGARVALMLGSTLAYFSNYVLAADTQAWAGGLAHTWSLAVEVHFYILWAVTVTWITRRRGMDLRLLTRIALGAAFASAAWRLTYWWVSGNADRVYAATETRLDSVFFGAGAALIRLRHLAQPKRTGLGSLGRWSVGAVELAGVSVVVVLVLCIKQGSPVASAGGYGLVGAITAALILTALLNPHSWVGRWATGSLPAWFGRISYSLYLWHVPASKLFTAERLAPLGWPPVMVEASRAAVSILLAVVSYYAVERFFLRLKGRLRTADTRP